MPVESAFEFQEGVPDGVDGVLEALVLGHDVDVLEDFGEVAPVLHQQHAGPIDVKDVD